MTWHVLKPILVREGIAGDAPHLFETVQNVAQSGDELTRRQALSTAAAALSADGDAARLLRALAGDDHPAARRLALELAARLPAEPVRLTWLRPLLRDRRIP